MTDLHRKTDVEIRLESLENLVMDLVDFTGMGTTAPTETDEILANIAVSLSHISIATLHATGLGVAKIENDQIIIDPPTEEMLDRSPPPRVLAGTTSTRYGDGGPLVWVLSPPAPFNDVEIACSPDGASPIGMRCHAVKRGIGGERRKFDLIPQEKEGL